MSKNSFVLYTRYIKYAESLSDEEFGALMRAVFLYEGNGELPADGSLTPRAALLFDVLRCDLEENSRKYEEVSEARRKARSKSKEENEEENKTEQKEQTRTKRTNANKNNKTEQKEQTQTNHYDMMCSDVMCSDNDIDSSAEAEENARARAGGAAAAVKEYEKLIGTLTPRVCEVLDSFALPEDVKVKAVQEAHDGGGRSLKYVEAVLKGYEKDGVKTVADAERRSAEYRRRKSAAGGASPPKESRYDFDEIEKLEFERRCGGGNRDTDTG